MELIVLAIIVIVLIIVIAIALKPSDFQYARSVTINAPASAVFPHVNDFRKWAAWSPWEKLDPNTKRTYEGAPNGIGAKYAWEGNRNVGSGRMTITESRANELIRLTLEFITPYKAVNTTDFTFQENGSQTTVTQSMYGCNGFMGKAMGLVMNMDKMIGTMFEKGLADLKAISESSSR